MPLWPLRLVLNVLRSSRSLFAHQGHHPQWPRCRRIHYRRLKFKRKDSSTTPRASLFEELFPEESYKQPTRRIEHDVPRMPLPLMEKDIPSSEAGTRADQRPAGEQADAAVENHDHWQWDLTALVLKNASRSLTESDFRRIAPRGQHIQDWRGPGDILKGGRRSTRYSGA